MVTSTNNHSNQNKTDTCLQPHLNDHPTVGDQVSNNHQK